MAKSKPTILLLGSGALKIGEAGEFDYSGSQALKVLREKGYRTVLVNPNVATVQTSEGMADAVYFSPVTPEFVERVIAKEKPMGILLAFGGQTALNCGVALERSGVLKKHGVAVLGTPVSSIVATEDRHIFGKKLNEIGVLIARSAAVKTVEEGLAAAKKIGYPVMARAAYTLGGQGSGIAADADALEKLLKKSFAFAPQVLIEESLYGWKEIEYEIVRDAADNCIAVCNMENFDPLGIHTGESIVIAPSQTLTNREYHFLRSISLKTVRHLGIVGECNIQFALHPDSGEYRVIEVNARLSRSSALASKATGYPLAAVACRIALGETLPQIKNPVTKSTSACFEPALDYVAVKIPRWDLKKFKRADRAIGSQMKSVGEVMALGRTFEEALQKAVRMIGRSWEGAWEPRMHFENLAEAVRTPSEKRLFAVAAALHRGWSVKKIYDLSFINPWFIRRVGAIVDIGEKLQRSGKKISPGLLRAAKQAGFSDRQIAALRQKTAAPTSAAVEQQRQERIDLGIVPRVKQIDTLAGEFPARTNYLYTTYNADSSDVSPIGRKAVAVLGSGVYRIGSSVEFDWSCVQALRTLRRKKIPSLLLNYNPETVSTDYDESDRLYFEELSAERVRDILDFERPRGTIVSMGGQTANNLVLPLHRAGLAILGTRPEDIDRAEDRHKFSRLLDELEIDQPQWQELTDFAGAQEFARKVGYPVLIRPSYVLSGAAMEVVHDEVGLERSLKQAARISPEHPVVISEFMLNTKELEFDGVAVRGKVVEWAIAEHIENAGVHSGDATLVYPAQRVYRETIFRMQRLAAKIAKALRITGPFNIQFLAKNNWLKVIECNVRASRSLPFVSKVAHRNLAASATRAILGESLHDLPASTLDLKYVGVKAPQFSFSRLPGADPVSGVEMASTGEVACLGEDLYDAFLQAQLAVGMRLPSATNKLPKAALVSIGGDRNRYDFLASAEQLHELGYTLYATENTAKFLQKNGITHTRVFKLHEDSAPNVRDLVSQRKLSMLLVVSNEHDGDSPEHQYLIRRLAIDSAIPLVTNLQLAKTLIAALAQHAPEELSVKAWGEWK